MDWNEILTRGVANIIPNKEALEKVLQSGKKLNIYLGIDPTHTHIHLGHAVPLRKLQQFADLGHNVTFLIGDFTALIGDTSDKESERPALSPEEIERNFQTYKKQAEKILDFSKIKVRYNSEWLKVLSFPEIIKLIQHFSFGDFGSRELIRKRLTEGKHVGLHEALYPVMQGYDSYFMDTDLQLGGTDQTFNMQAGRSLQKDLRHKESFVMTNEFLEGTDGRKMSKTWGNAIWLDDPAEDMYGKIMSVRDDLIIRYFTLATNLPISQIEEHSKRLDSGENPMELKKTLAHTIVREFNEANQADSAQKAFENIVQKGELPDDIPSLTINRQEYSNVVDILVNANLAHSKSEAKRLTIQGGVEVEDKVITNPAFTLERGEYMLKVGKRRFLKLIVE